MRRGVAPESFTHKLVVATRRDLKLSPGKLAVQVAHAAVACALRLQQEHPKVFATWLREGQKKVVVRVETLKDLASLQRDAEGQRLVTAWIEDAGHTEVEPGTATVLGVGPGPNETVDRVTGHLPLL